VRQGRHAFQAYLARLACLACLLLLLASLQSIFARRTWPGPATLSPPPLHLFSFPGGVGGGAVPPGHSQEEEEDTYISTELCHLDTLRRRRRTHTSAQSCATWTLSLSCCRHSSSSRSHVSICMLDYYHYHYCHCCYYCCLSQCPHCNAQILNPEPSVHAGAEGIEGWSIRQ